MITRILGYFLTGLAIVIPVLVTTWFLHYLVTSVQAVLSLEHAIIGLAVALLGILIIGFLVSFYFGQLFWSRVESIVIRVPLVGIIYKSIKDVTTAFVGKDNRFSEPVLVKMTDQGIFKIGFVTNKDASILLSNHETSILENNLVAIYFPLSFSLSGELYFVAADKIQPINKKSKDIMQAIVSGGIIQGD